MSRIIYEARLNKITSVTPLMRELIVDFVKPPEMGFQAGQFVMMHVPDPTQPKPLLRAYSLASDDKVKTSFTLLIKLLGEGRASQFIRDLKGGEDLQFTGPFGKLTFREPIPSQVLFLCTGAGLSQHMSFLLSHGQRFPQTRFRLLVGVWNEAEIFYQKELEFLKKRIAQFEYEFVLDAPAADWKGKKGYITDFISQFDYKERTTDIYLCGNPAMIKGAKDYLAKNQFPEDHVFAESFG